MTISELIADFLGNMLEEEGVCEVQRRDIANMFGCVPSQINYVIMTRFTPEQGYIVESRRGGGGYIKITRLRQKEDVARMHIVNSIGETLDAATARVYLINLTDSGILTAGMARLIDRAQSAEVMRLIPKEQQDKVRAAIFKQCLMACDEQKK